MGAFANAIAGVYATLFGLIANIIGTITGAFLAASVGIFNWITSENFISLSYTKLDNPFIQVGWTLTRDLTNIFFVIALIIIGIGTALRRQNYQYQKALPTLIAIILLINFTPVILGLIVDASNIIMNFFLQGGFASGNSFVNQALSQWANVGSLAKGLKFWDPTASSEATAAAAGSIVLIFFNLIAALIYLIFAFVFIVRYIAIWTLTILSPLAFASFVLPATKGPIWNLWWKQFTQWSIVGPIAAFFLYLGDHLMRVATQPGFISSSLAETSQAPGFSGIFNSILPYFIGLAFLIIGLFASLTFAPMGAKGIIQAGQKGINKASTIASRAGWQGMKDVARAPVRFGQGVFGALKGQRLQDKAFAQQFFPGVPQKEAEKMWRAQTTPTQRMKVGLKRTGEAIGKGLKGAVPAPMKKAAQEIFKAPGAFVEGVKKDGVGKVWDVAKKEASKITATEGLRKAVADVWGAARGKTKKKGKKGTKTGFIHCPICSKEIHASAKACSECGANLEE